MSRPKLLERFTGYVCDKDDATLYLINQKQNEQMEIPLAQIPRAVRERVSEGTYAYLLIYDNRVSFRLTNVGRWTALELRQAKKRGRKLFRQLRATLPEFASAS